MRTIYKSDADTAHSGRRMLQTCFILLSLLFLFNQLWGQNQQRRWFLNAKDVNYNTVPPNVAATPNVDYYNPGAQIATNGVHNQNNSRVFNINGTKLYGEGLPSNAGIPIFQLGGNQYVNTEVVVFPKPGSCDSFYIFYGRRTYTWSNGCPSYELRYYLVDRNLLVMPYPEDALVEDVSLFNKAFSPSDHYCPPAVPLAASKEKLVNGVKTRQLFYLDYDYVSLERKFSLRRIDITPNSISNPFTLFTHADQFDMHTYELELSPDGSKLALGRHRNSTYSPSPFLRFPDKDIVLYHLNPNGSLNTTLGTGGVTYIDIPHTTGYEESVVGIEFNAASNRLFASVANDRIYYITDLNNTTPTVNPMNQTQTQPFTFSQMELVYNNGIEYIAVAKNQSEVHVISGTSIPNIPTISSSALFSNANVPEDTYAYPIVAKGSTTNPPTRYLLCLPDQVDGDNYTGSAGGWFDPNNSTKCCMNYYATTIGNDYTVYTSETWTPSSLQTIFGTSQPVFDGTLTINPGVTLTLQGVTLRFHPNARMVIKQGGKVNLYGSTLTGLSCGLMWQGVRVYGNSNLSQTTTNQGLLNIAASGVRSKIENAWCAVALYNKEGDPNATTTSGGMIQGAFTDFLNNWMDIDFKNYTFTTSASNVRYCTFIVNNSYLSTTYSHRVKLKNISGIKFYACTFANDKTSFQTSSNTMEGIDAEDANFGVEQWCGSIPCQGVNIFRNFLLGIRAKYLTTQRNFTCKYATFNNNMFGILSEGVNNFITTNNTFNVGFNGNFLYNAGLYVNVGTGFTIQLNNFQGNGITALPISIGCYVFNSGPNTNLVYKNTYNALWEANGAENINRAAQDAIGLFYQCNNQSQGLLDMYVYGGGLTGQNYGIRENHFTTTLVNGQVRTVSPNNTFSQNSSFLNGHQWNDIYLDNTSNINDNILYKWNSSIPLSEPIYHTDLPVTPFVHVTPADINNNPCSGGGGSGLIAGGGSYNSMEEAYATAKSEYETALYLYQSLIDDGNTALLKQSIDVWGQSAWDLRNQLLTKSPNLSADVIEYTARQGLLPSALLFDVCIANLSSVKDAKFLQLLQSSEIPHPLTSYMVELIYNAEEPHSYRKILEGALNNSILDFSYISNERIADLLANEGSHDTIAQLISLLPGLSSKYQLAEFKLSKNEIADALSILDGIETTTPDVVKTDPRFPAYKDFMSYLAAHRSALTSGDTLPGDVRIHLESIAVNPEHPGYVTANNILRADGNWTYTAVPKFPDGSAKKEFGVVDKIQFNPANNATLKLYPNPADKYVTLDLTYIAVYPLTVEIVDYAGKILSATVITPSKTGNIISNISIQDLPAGTFVVTIKENDKKVISKPFTKY